MLILNQRACFIAHLHIEENDLMDVFWIIQPFQFLQFTILIFFLHIPGVFGG